MAFLSWAREEAPQAPMIAQGAPGLLGGIEPRKWLALEASIKIP